MRTADAQRATLDTEPFVCYCRRPSMSGLSGVSSSSSSSCCGAVDESPESPGEEGWTNCPQRQARPLRRGTSREAEKAVAFRSYEKYFEHKMYVFGHKYSSKYRQWRSDSTSAQDAGPCVATFICPRKRDPDTNTIGTECAVQHRTSDPCNSRCPVCN